MFKGYYRSRFREIFGNPLKPTDGFGDVVVERALRRRGMVIPRALFDYYAVAGRHEVNESHNRLFAVSELQWEGHMLVFMEENQSVALWGISENDLQESNPVVWQGQAREPIEWFKEPYRLSQFLMAMWRWQLTGVQEPPSP